jgi:hypothetical protein
MTKKVLHHMANVLWLQAVVLGRVHWLLLAKTPEISHSNGAESNGATTLPQPWKGTTVENGLTYSLY